MKTSNTIPPIQKVRNHVKDLLLPVGFKKIGRNKYVKVQSDDVIIHFEVVSYVNSSNSGLEIDVTVTSKELLRLDEPSLASQDWLDKGYFFYPHIEISISSMSLSPHTKFEYPRTMQEANLIIEQSDQHIKSNLSRVLQIKDVKDILVYWNSYRFLSDNRLLTMYLELKFKGLLDGTELYERKDFFNYLEKNLVSAGDYEKLWQRIKDGKF